MKRLFFLSLTLLALGSTETLLAQDIPHPSQYIEIKPIEVQCQTLSGGRMLVRWWAEPYFKYHLEIRAGLSGPSWAQPSNWRWLSYHGWMSEVVQTSTLDGRPRLIRVEATANEGYLAGPAPLPEADAQALHGTPWYPWLDPLYDDILWKHMCYSRKLFPQNKLYLTPWGISDYFGYLVPANQIPAIGTWGAGGQLQHLLMTGSIRDVIKDVSDNSWREVYDNLSSEPAVYKSNGLETNHWSGTIITEPGKPIWLYGRSDDGARYTVNGTVEYDTFGLGQPWDNLSRSFAFICCLAGGTTNQIAVDYSNIHYAGSSDSDDGITLFVVGDNARDGRIIGDSDLDWYGADGSENFTFWLDAHASSVTWEVSSNLVVNHQDNQLRTVDICATGASTFPGSDWIRALWTPACGGTQIVATLSVTVFKPTAVNRLSVTNWLDLTGHRMYCTLQYQMLDQFGSPFPFTCLVSEQTWTMGLETPPEWDIEPDAHDQNALAGRFQDAISSRPYGRLLIRGQVIWAHRTRGAQMGINIMYNRIYFDAPSILVTPVNPP